MTLKQKVLSFVALCAAMLVVAAPVASAQTATQQGYDETGVLGGIQQQGVAGDDDAGAGVQVVSDDGDSSLPFTGADLGILLAMGLALGATGLVLRRAARRSTT